MKDMTSVATTMMTEEEKAEIERQMNSNNSKMNNGPPTPAMVDSVASTPQRPTPAPATTFPPAEAHTTDGATEKSPTETHPPATASSSSNALGPNTATAAEKELREQEKREAARRKAEQREKLKEHDRQRRKAMEERVAILTKKMIDRLRPFVDAKDPGGKDDPESNAFADRMKREVEDLKLESFGVEVICDCLAGIIMSSDDVKLDLFSAPPYDWHRIYYESHVIYEVAEVLGDVSCAPE